MKKKTKAATPSQSKKSALFSISGVAEISKKQRSIATYFFCPSTSGDMLGNSVNDDVFGESHGESRGESSGRLVADPDKAQVADQDLVDD